MKSILIFLGLVLGVKHVFGNPITYTHVLDLEVSRATLLGEEEIAKEMKVTQEYFNQCGILIRYTFKREVDPDLQDWEAFWYNDYKISDVENKFGMNNQFKKPHLLFVDNVNWTLKGQGVWGVAYASYLLDQMKMPSETKDFMLKNLMGLIVVGQYRAKWTVAHELAHAILNLEHIDDKNNIMDSGQSEENFEFEENGQLKTSLKPTFSISQCEQKKFENHFLKPLK